jgi:hypothetical protein
MNYTSKNSNELTATEFHLATFLALPWSFTPEPCQTCPKYMSIKNSFFTYNTKNDNAHAHTYLIQNGNAHAQIDVRRHRLNLIYPFRQLVLLKRKKNQIHRTITTAGPRISFSPEPDSCASRGDDTRRRAARARRGTNRDGACSHVDVAEADAPQGHRPRRQRVSEPIALPTTASDPPAHGFLTLFSFLWLYPAAAALCLCLSV